jgi:hypothetical protein
MIGCEIAGLDAGICCAASMAPVSCPIALISPCCFFVGVALGPADDPPGIVVGGAGIPRDAGGGVHVLHQHRLHQGVEIGADLVAALDAAGAQATGRLA